MCPQMTTPVLTAAEFQLGCSLEFHLHLSIAQLALKKSKPRKDFNRQAGPDFHGTAATVTPCRVRQARQHSAANTNIWDNSDTCIGMYLFLVFLDVMIWGSGYIPNF